MFPFHCLGYTEGSVQALRQMYRFCNKGSCYAEELLVPHPPPSQRTTPCQLSMTVIQYICSYPPYWRLFLHQQPEDIPCHSDRCPLTMETGRHDTIIVTLCSLVNVLVYCSESIL
jgi:hypothetical protein